MFRSAEDLAAKIQEGFMDFDKVIAAEPVERKFAKALKSGAIKALDADAQLAEAERSGLVVGAANGGQGQIEARFTIEAPY